MGAVAQLGERNAGSVEVIGSIPFGSTNYKKDLGDILSPFYLYILRITVVKVFNRMTFRLRFRVPSVYAVNSSLKV
jgi:hypothetical protein